MLAAKKTAGVKPKVDLRNPAYAGDEAREQEDPPWLWNPGQMLPEVQNRGTSSPTKSTNVHQKFEKKFVRASTSL